MGLLANIRALRSDSRNEETVFVLGLRGFPNVQGGVETHAENLYPLVAQAGLRVICATRSGFHDAELLEWQGVRFLPIWAPQSRFLEAFVHSLLAVFCAAIIRPSIVHIHAIGPALVTPLARLFGLRVVVTHHGPDYDREKWNKVARAILRLGEWCGMTFASERIVISPVIEEWVRHRFDSASHIIPNGVPIPVLDSPLHYLDEFGLDRQKYLLLVSRFVPEKRHLDLIEAFEKLDQQDLKLVLVGGADHPDKYEQAVKTRAGSNPDIVLTGVLRGEALKAIYEHAAVFVLPSSHEGLPICLLEALSFGLRCTASDIPANIGVGLADSSYFHLGDICELTAKLKELLGQDWTYDDREQVRDWVSRKYNWMDIAKSTTEVYRRAGQ